MKTTPKTWSNRARGLAAAFLAASAGVMPCLAQPAEAPPPEQMDYFKAMQLSRAGAGIVLNLDLPRAFLERPAGRALRYALRGKFRHVKPDARPSDSMTGAAPAWVTVKEVTLAPAILETWGSWKPTIPLTRGFRAPLFTLDDAYASDRTLSAAVGERAKAYAEGQSYVSERLARDGLITTAMTLTTKVRRPWVSAETLNRLEFKWCGIPTDLLDCYTIEGQPAATYIAAWIGKGSPPDNITLAARGAVFNYQPSCPGFQIPLSDGTEDPGLLRLQLSQDTEFRAVGDGSAVDCARQLAEALPDCPILVSTDLAGLDRVKGMLGAAMAGIKRSAPVTVVGTVLPVTPWAQDNAVAGRAGVGGVTTIVPRFASINEQSSQFMPGDSLVFETLREKESPIGQVYHSRLLFQGGNIAAIPDLASGKSILLVGEAEIYRNRALGLGGDQAATALGLEFGAGRVSVMPATSFHIDMEMTIRRMGDELVACMNDEIAASFMIFKCGADALQKAGALRSDHHERVLKAIETRDNKEMQVAVSLVWDAIAANVDGDGYLGEKIKTALTGSASAGAGTVERLMLAMDQIDAFNLTDDQVVARNPEDWFKRYLLSLRQRTAERAELVKQVEKLGIRVVRVPSTSEDNLSTNYINGVQTKGAYLMPAFGGIFTELDEAAAAAIGKAFEGVQVTPIACGRVQEKYGALHCMVGVYPK